MSVSSLVVVSLSHLLVCFTYDKSLLFDADKSTVESPRRTSENDKMLNEFVNTNIGGIAASVNSQSPKYQTLTDEV